MTENIRAGVISQRVVVIADFGGDGNAGPAFAMIAQGTFVFVRTHIRVVRFKFAAVIGVTNIVGASVSVAANDGGSDTKPDRAMVILRAGIGIAASVCVVGRIHAEACV